MKRQRMLGRRRRRTRIALLPVLLLAVMLLPGCGRGAAAHDPSSLISPGQEQTGPDAAAVSDGAGEAEPSASEEDGEKDAEQEPGGDRDGDLSGDVQDGDLSGDIQDGDPSGDPDGDLSGDTQDGDLSGDTQDGDLSGDVQDGDLSGDTQDGDPSGDVQGGTQGGDAPDHDTSQTALTVADAVTFLCSLSPQVLGLEGDSMDEYTVYPAEGLVTVDGELHTELSVYRHDGEAGTNDFQGCYLLSRGPQRRLYLLDRFTREVTELPLEAT